MIRRTIELGWSLIILGCLAYVFFTVPLGKRTMFEHLVRIAETDEAQELGDEAVEAGARTINDIGDRIERIRDAGAKGQAARDTTMGAEPEASPASH